MSRYLREPAIDLEDDSLEWWARRWEEDYPGLAPAARYYLAIPGASVMAESTNSEAGWLVDKRRTSMVPHTVATLVYIHRTLRDHGDNFSF